MGVVHISARTLIFTFVWIVLCRSSIGQHCGHPGNPAFNKFEPSDFYELGQRMSYECVDGYLLNSPFRNVTELATSGQRECLPNGTWSHENAHCYRTLPVQTLRCDGRYVNGRFQYVCILPQTSDTAPDLLLITSLYHKDISGLNVTSCEVYFDKAQQFNTSSALFRFPLDKITNRCRPLLDEGVSVATSAWDQVSVTPYARNNLCGIPETPANGKLIRVNASTVRHVCNSGYQLEGNEYRNCVDSFWYGTQVICNKIAEQNESDQFSRSPWNGTQVICNTTTDESKNDQYYSSPYDTLYIIAVVAITLSMLALLSIFVTVFVIKRILKQRTHSNTDTHTSTTKNAKIVDTPVDTAPVYYEIQDNRVGASGHLYELPIQCSLTRPL